MCMFLCSTGINVWGCLHSEWHNWCNKGSGMCYPVCGMVHIKERLLLIDKSSLCGSSGFPFSLRSWCGGSSDQSFMGWTHWAISRSSQCSTTGVTKAVVCVILSGMVHIKDPLLLIDKSSLCGGSGFPFSLSEWFLTIRLTPYNRR